MKVVNGLEEALSQVEEALSLWSKRRIEVSATEIRNMLRPTINEAAP